MRVGIPREIKNNEYRVAITPAGVHELRRHGHEVYVEAGAGVGSSITDEEYAAAGATILPDADEVLGGRRDDSQGQGADRRGVPAAAPRPPALHLPASGRVEGVHRRAPGGRDHRGGLRDRRAARRQPAAAGSDVRGGRPPGPDGRGVPPDARRRRPRHAARRRSGRLRIQSRRYRRRRRRDERGGDRGRHAGRGAAAGQEHRPAAGRRRALPGAPADGRLQRVRDREGRARRRPGHRRGAGRRGEGAHAHQQRACLPDAQGQRARRHIHRPRRLFRGLPPDHARRPGLPGARQHLLLRGEHARGGAAHLDLRADQRDLALRARAGRPRLAGGDAQGPGPGARAQHPRRAPRLRAGGPGPRHDRDQAGGGSRLTADATDPRDGGLRGLIDAYLDQLAVERGLAANTVAAYRRDLDRYARFLAGTGTPFAAVDERVVTAYLRSLREPAGGQESVLSAASAARALSAVRGLHQFAAREGHAPTDPSRPVAPPTLPRRLPHALGVDEVHRLLAAARTGDEPLALRDVALLELLYATGARISEAVGLAVDDVDLADPPRAGPAGGSSVLLRGKGGRVRVVPLGGYARDALAAYLVRARPVLLSAAGRTAGGSRRSGAPGRPELIFRNARGGPLTRQGAWLVLRSAAARAGLGPVSPHVLRHSFATHLLDGGADVRVVQELLGHASVTTTQVYTLVTVEKLREVYAVTHPRALVKNPARHAES